MSKPPQATITRKARIWPEISRETIELPNPPNPVQAGNPVILITMLCSMAGLGVYAFILPKLGGSSFVFVGIFVMSGCVMLGALANFLFQWIPGQRRKRQLFQSYEKMLLEASKQLYLLSQQERQGQLALDPPLVFPLAGAEPMYEQLHLLPITQRDFTNQDVHLWTRRPDDPDFLAVRIGMGQQAPAFKLSRMPTKPSTTLSAAQLKQWAELENLVSRYQALSVPIKIDLGFHPAVAILGSDSRLAQARQLTMLMIAYLAYHHSPEDLRIIVLTAESQRDVWEWTMFLPHTQLYDPKRAGEESEPSFQEHAVAIGNAAVLTLLPLISREVSRRELLHGDIHLHMQDRVKPLLPRLIIVVDHFDEEKDLDRPPQFLALNNMPTRSTHASRLNRPRLTTPPLHRAEMTLALNAGKSLGVSVLAICGHASALPPSTGLLVDLDEPPATSRGSSVTAIRARVRYLQADAPTSMLCDWVDEAPLEALHYFATRLQPLHPTTPKRLELRTQVDMSILFEPPLDLTHYDPMTYWKDPVLRSANGQPLMRIPIGLKIGDEKQYLDLLKDGPHGLLIGQTGSGKSELLQTIIAALAVSYQPTEINFLLIDYKAGLALEPFSRLPHTIGFLSNVSSAAMIKRFIAMLKAEATRRELRLKAGKSTPRLVIIIDEFAEMVKRTDNVLEELFTITRVGREIGMHLLLAAQRPEGIIGSKMRDYVQYRLCLRCASPEDSREILRRVDAASLPASIPGRSYLLHGDNQLDLFQAARVSMLVTPFGQPFSSRGSSQISNSAERRGE